MDRYEEIDLPGMEHGKIETYRAGCRCKRCCVLTFDERYKEEKAERLKQMSVEDLLAEVARLTEKLEQDRRMLFVYEQRMRSVTVKARRTAARCAGNTEVFIRENQEKLDLLREEYRRRFDLLPGDDPCAEIRHGNR